MQLYTTIHALGARVVCTGWMKGLEQWTLKGGERVLAKLVHLAEFGENVALRQASLAHLRKSGLQYCILCSMCSLLRDALCHAILANDRTLSSFISEGSSIAERALAVMESPSLQTDVLTLLEATGPHCKRRDLLPNPRLSSALQASFPSVYVL